MVKEDVVHIYNRILVIKKNEIMPFVATWMNLEMTILSKVDQRKTNIIGYHLYVESKKKDANELTSKTETNLWLPMGKVGGGIN